MPDAYVAPQRRPDLGDGPSALNAGDRAVRIGAGIVFLSLVSAFATYLILTGLTPMRTARSPALRAEGPSPRSGRRCGATYASGIDTSS